MIETRRLIGQTTTGPRDSGQQMILSDGRHVGIIFDTAPHIALCHVQLTEKQKREMLEVLPQLTTIRCAGEVPRVARAYIEDLL